MFSFLKNKPKEEQTMCVLMVNSYSITASVVRTYHREGAVTKPVVIFSCEEKIMHHRTTEASLESLVEHEVKKVLEQCRKVHGNYDKLVCVMGEPWLVNKSRHITIEKTSPFKITQKIIDDAMVRDARLFEQEALRDYARDEMWGIMHTTKPIVEANGYMVKNPVGISAKSFLLHTTVALAPAAFVEMILGVYADVFHRVDVSFSGLDTAFSRIAKEYNQITVITLGGVSGTCLVFNRGLMSYSEKINTGLAMFENAIARLFGVDQRHSASVMRFASDENFLEHERDIYYQRIEMAYKKMSDEIRMIMLRIKKQMGHISGPVILIMDPVWAKALKPMIEVDINKEIEVIQTEMFDEFLIYTHTARVKNSSLSLAILAGLE